MKNGFLNWKELSSLSLFHLFSISFDFDLDFITQEKEKAESHCNLKKVITIKYENNLKILMKVRFIVILLFYILFLFFLYSFFLFVFIFFTFIFYFFGDWVIHHLFFSTERRRTSKWVLHDNFMFLRNRECQTGKQNIIKKKKKFTDIDFNKKKGKI